MRKENCVNVSQDKLLDIIFSEMNIWENAINDGNDKKIKINVLENYSDPNYRLKIKEEIQRHKYHIMPPHEALIPKDDGTMRTVYANEAKDRVLLTVINNVFFKYCSHMIDKNCLSYQLGIGCGKIDKQVVKDIQSMHITSDRLGYKLDLSKYFDTVPIEYIDNVFDEIEKQFGPSSILDLVREYYHDDVLLDLNRNEIHKYTSLRQGCAIAAFLADAVLCDVDKTISNNFDVLYYRYSDDILILGADADAAYEKISIMLKEKSLTLNPNKVEPLDKNHWFTFLGFSIRNHEITLSKKRIKNLQRVIEDLTIHCKAKNYNSNSAMKRIYTYLYDNSITKYGYADGILPVINVKHDIQELDNFILDCLRACDTGNKKVGGLGYDKKGRHGVISRGKGRNVKTNRDKIPFVKGYIPVSHMQKLYMFNRNAYDTYVKDMILT